MINHIYLSVFIKYSTNVLLEIFLNEEKCTEWSVRLEIQYIKACTLHYSTLKENPVVRGLW